jgi:hypothetical protein
VTSATNNSNGSSRTMIRPNSRSGEYLICIELNLKLYAVISLLLDLLSQKCTVVAFVIKSVN